LGVGSTFTIRLPAAVAEAEAELASHAEPGFEPAPGSVVISHLSSSPIGEEKTDV